MSFKAPNHTQTPNDLFALLPDMGEAELKVTLVIVRDTFGWQQGGAATERSLTELMELTGLSRQGVLNGIKAGKARGTVYQIKGGSKAAYGLVVNSVDQSTTLTSPPSRPQLVNTVDRAGQPSRPALVNEVDRSTPAQAAPGEAKPGAERQLKERERKERKKTTTTGEDLSPVVAAVPQAVENPHDDTGSGADRAVTPDGASAAAAQTVTDDPAEGEDVTGQATDTEKVPGAAGGAARAALVGALAPLKVPDLLEKFAFRAGWLALEPARIRELADLMRIRHGSRRFRSELIEALDEEVLAQSRTEAPETPTPTTDDDIDMGALIDSAPLDGNRRRV